MHHNTFSYAFLTLLAAGLGIATPVGKPSLVTTFKVNLSDETPRMLKLIKESKLPDEPEYPGIGSTFGIDLDVLKGLKQQWLHDFDWNKQQDEINKYNHFTTKIENLDIHFIHHKSSSPDAIPLLLLHGWPGSFLEFLPLINPLTSPKNTTSPSFHIIIPSLPGFAFSSAPPANWTNADTARIFNTLMTSILGYEKYAIHATDWGADVGYSLYGNYNTTVRAGHFAFIPFFPLNGAQLAEEGVVLESELERFELEMAEEWRRTGNGYFILQSTKPNTIGLALSDNPVGQLAWIGEKMIDWSDPRAGSGPSVLDRRELLTGVSLFYLTKSFVSSTFIYAQNPNGFKDEYTKAATDAPLLFSAFKYNVGFWPPAKVAQVGNLVSYRNHDFGGHFPGLDNPAALVEDLREITTYWVTS
ncbi:Alpha/Beta hydrolase protein [Immersiella caudata]|uniref:Alpha/Beta hydrolase protein n=1 Tax=Immersiella caudata TaxID=314043 RepID=A0AA40BZK0_9PEZI|nr:Alpha/Beta hydrolase protein [Immersiella caudata]